MASLTQGSTPTPRTFRSRMASAWGTSKRVGAGARDFSKRWIFSGRHHEAGMEWMKFGTGLKRKMPLLGRALGLGFLGYNAVSGYEEGGIWGATKSVATDFALNYAFGRLMSLTGAIGAKALGVGAATTSAGSNQPQLAPGTPGLCPRTGTRMAILFLRGIAGFSPRAGRCAGRGKPQ